VPRLSALLVRTALLHLVLGAAFGALIASLKGAGWPTWAWGALSAHAHMLVFGWLVQLAMGVAYWILPRLDGARPRSGLVWAAYAGLNGGILLIALGPTGLLGGAGAPAGHAALLAAVAAYAVHAWPRVRVAG